MSKQVLYERLIYLIIIYDRVTYVHTTYTHIHIYYRLKIIMDMITEIFNLELYVISF